MTPGCSLQLFRGSNINAPAPCDSGLCMAGLQLKCRTVISLLHNPNDCSFDSARHTSWVGGAAFVGSLSQLDLNVGLVSSWSRHWRNEHATTATPKFETRQIWDWYFIAAKHPNDHHWKNLQRLHPNVTGSLLPTHRTAHQTLHSQIADDLKTTKDWGKAIITPSNINYCSSVVCTVYSIHSFHPIDSMDVVNRKEWSGPFQLEGLN